MDDTENFWLAEDQWVSCLYTIVKMYALGDKYDLKRLKHEAEERFTTRLDDWLIEQHSGYRSRAPRPSCEIWYQ